MARIAFKGVDYGDVPQELVAIAHYQGDLAEEIALPFERLKTEDSTLSTGGVQEAQKAS